MFFWIKQGTNTLCTLVSLQLLTTFTEEITDHAQMTHGIQISLQERSNQGSKGPSSYLKCTWAFICWITTTLKLIPDNLWDFLHYLYTDWPSNIQQTSWGKEAYNIIRKTKRHYKNWMQWPCAVCHCLKLVIWLKPPNGLRKTSYHI
jgi:hypothetical protein